VGRLTEPKDFAQSIKAMSLLKAQGVQVRWYILGEGDQRPELEALIKKLGLEQDFLLCGAVDNPYNFLKQADIYVHATRYEGKSVAIREAKILGKPMLVSDCSGNREQVVDGVDGRLCELTPEAICAGVRELLDDEEKCAKWGAAAAGRQMTESRETEKLLSLLTNE
jgi:glycosyltransferase involved in cell wall biosynthesis